MPDVVCPRKHNSYPTPILAPDWRWSLRPCFSTLLKIPFIDYRKSVCRCSAMFRNAFANSVRRIPRFLPQNNNGVSISVNVFRIPVNVWSFNCQRLLEPSQICKISPNDIGEDVYSFHGFAVGSFRYIGIFFLQYNRQLNAQRMLPNVNMQLVRMDVFICRTITQIRVR